MGEQKATLTIAYEDGADTSALAIAALDDELNRTASGEVKSQFTVTDRPYFWVHLDANLRIVQVKCSSGSARYLGIATRTAKLDTMEVDEAGDTQELEYNPLVTPIVSWYGNTPTITRHGRTLTFTGALPATGKGSYPFRVYSYQYTPPALPVDATWRSRIVIHVAAA